MDIRFEVNTTNMLILLNVLLFIVTGFFALILTGSIVEYLLVGNNEALELMGADAYSLTIASGELWRLLTASFLHGNLVHLLVNMYALSIFGKVFEYQFSGKKLFSVYVITGIGASLFSNFMAFIGFSATNVLSVGASGALFGILGYLLVSPYANVDKQRLYYMILLNVLIGIVFAGVINNFAHLGGLFTGIAYAYADKNYSLRKIGQQIKFDLVYALALTIFMLSYAALIIYSFVTIFNS